ncbi:MAG TPA: hypothetical protein VN181_03025, partial [Thermoanaerobaculia bacterium]|nr:hypothetical protein [Thermoanaerobaculia bacterium]
MGLLVTFHGICTFLTSQMPGVQLPMFGARMVLVNASTSSAVDAVKGKYGSVADCVVPHFAMLNIRLEDIVSVGPLSVAELTTTDGFVRFHLNQVTLGIPNAIGPFAANTECLPNLSATVETLGVLNSAAIFDFGDKMASYFDFGGGTLSSFSVEGGAAS